jgi:hypothetical protein
VSDQAAGPPASPQNGGDRPKRFLETWTWRITALGALVGAVYGLWVTIQQFIPKHEETSLQSPPAASPTLTTAKTVTKETATATPVSTTSAQPISSVGQPEWVMVNAQQELEDFPTTKSPDGQWHDYSFTSTFLHLPYQVQLQNPRATADREGDWNHSNFNPEMQKGDPVVDITPDGQRVAVSYKTFATTSFKVRIWADVYRQTTSK